MIKKFKYTFMQKRIIFLSDESVSSKEVNMKHSKSLQRSVNVRRGEQECFKAAKIALQEGYGGLSKIFKVDRIFMQSCLRSGFNTPQALTKKINLDKRLTFMATTF